VPEEPPRLVESRAASQPARRGEVLQHMRVQARVRRQTAVSPCLREAGLDALIFLHFGFLFSTMPAGGRELLDAGGPDDGLAMRARPGDQTQGLARDWELHEPDRAQGLQGGIEREGEIGTRQRLMQGAAEEQRQVRHEQMGPHPGLRLMINVAHFHEPLEFAEGALHHQQFFVGGDCLRAHRFCRSLSDT